MGWCHTAVTGIEWESLGENLSLEQGSGQVILRLIDRQPAAAHFLTICSPRCSIEMLTGNFGSQGTWTMAV